MTPRDLPRGVSRRKDRFRAQVRIHGKQREVGLFLTAEAAAAAVEAALVAQEVVPKLTDWTEEMIAKLRARWLTAPTKQNIADELGVSLHSLVGKSRHLDLPSRRGLQQTPRAKAVASAAPAPNPRPPRGLNALSAALSATVTPEPGRNCCQWPVDRVGRTWLFCGAAVTAPGRSYCDGHHVQAHGRGTPAERAAHRVAA